MEERTLGATGVRTSALGLGTAALAVPYGPPQGKRDAPARGEAVDTVLRALARGVRFIDTAPAYGDAEAIVGEAAPQAGCVIATKLAIPAAGWAALDDRALRDHVRASAERSVTALGRAPLDVLQVPNATAADVERGALPAVLAELRDEGLVGLTGATVYGEEAALACAGTFDLMQVAMSALDRRPEARVLSAATECGTAVVARSALLSGVLSWAGERLSGPFAPLRDVADTFRTAAGASWDELPGVAVAWLLARPGIDCVLLGPHDAAELDALIDGSRRFANPPDGDWGAGLGEDLLDPSRWPALEGVP